ncbi:MAG: mitochondrial fission ELM1 family protein [Tistlia sp.]|uniref:mitochondrial fission ELM1 family protein n=1 Tax=Tistlia sp. TaxID=3057121 RepID=UPI0034A118FA
MPLNERESCWVVSDGKAGMEIQCLGLAEALGLEPQVKRIVTRRPWRWLPPLLWHDPLRAIDRRQGDALDPPWPDLLIATGRQAVAPALAIRRASRRAGRASFVVQIQNPAVDPKRFDLVVAPAHDRLSGPNVVTTLGAMNRITPARLEAEARAWGPRVAALPRPYVGALVGGANKVYRLPPARARELGEQLAAAAGAEGGSLLVTPSRRTRPAVLAALRAGIGDTPCLIWDGTGENPYFGFLGLADALVVTLDSVNMISEAASTGRPVLLAELPGGSAKFRRFHEAMLQAGYARPFAGRLERWDYPRLDETGRVAGLVRERLKRR